MRTSLLTGHISSLRSLNSMSHNPSQVMDVAMALARTLTEQHGTPSQTPPSSISQAVAELGYHYTNLIILRAALRPFLGTDSGITNTSDDSSQVHSIRESMKSCTKDFSNFIGSLTVEKINGVWPPWAQPAVSSLCFTLLMMAVSTSGYDEAVAWIKVLQSTRRDLRLKAKSLPVLCLGLLRIDSVFWKGVENVLQLPPHVVQAFSSLSNTS